LLALILGTKTFARIWPKVDVPTLVIHGDADRILPISASGLRTARLIKNAQLLVVHEGHIASPGLTRKK